MAKNILTDNLSEPLAGATTAKLDIDVADGNLTIDKLTSGEPVLASGTLQYFEKKGAPTRTLVARDGQATFTLRGTGNVGPWFHFPWAGRNSATEWQIHLNPAVPSDITVHSDGGNVKLDLTGMTITRLSADTGGGNMDVVLPDSAASLSVTAKTGAGNVDVCIPRDLAVCIHATTGLGKVIVDPRFSQTDKSTYQSPDYDSATHKVEITLNSGAGNVNVNTK